jgi:hypothetical protein
MARLVYASRFDVSGTNAMTEVLSTYRDWVVNDYRDKRALTAFDFDPVRAGDVEGVPTGHSLASEAFEDGDERAVRFRWSFPDDSDRGPRCVPRQHLWDF